MYSLERRAHNVIEAIREEDHVDDIYPMQQQQARTLSSVPNSELLYITGRQTIFSLIHARFCDIFVLTYQVKTNKNTRQFKNHSLRSKNEGTVNNGVFLRSPKQSPSSSRLAYMMYRPIRCAVYLLIVFIMPLNMRESEVKKSDANG